MTNITWVRVGADLFIKDESEHDGIRHPSAEEFDALIALWNSSPLNVMRAFMGVESYVVPLVTNVVGNLTRSNLDTWLEHQALKSATPRQRDMYGSGVLPQSELLSLARDELFAMFADVPRWRQLTYANVQHRDGCRARVDIAGFEITPAELETEQGVNFAGLREACDALAVDHPWLVRQAVKPTLRVYGHCAVCTSCKQSVRKWSTRISIPWAGRDLTREYALQ